MPHQQDLSPEAGAPDAASSAPAAAQAAAQTVAQTAAQSVVRQEEGGEMHTDARGGWRLKPERRAVMAHADLSPPHPPTGVPKERGETPDEAEERARRGFAGNAEHPAHGHPHAGTQGTWDHTLGTGHPPLESPAREEGKANTPAVPASPA